MHPTRLSLPLQHFLPVDTSKGADGQSDGDEDSLLNKRQRSALRNFINITKITALATGIAMVNRAWSKDKDTPSWRRAFEAKMVLVFVYVYVGSCLVGRARWWVFAVFRRNRRTWIPLQSVLGLGIAYCGKHREVY